VVNPVKYWKIILVTLVIFSTGVVTGALVARRTQRAEAGLPWRHAATNRVEQGARLPERWMRRDFVSRIQSELELTPEQAGQMEAIVRESQARTRQLWDEFSPQIRAEFKDTQARIREVLTPEQQRGFEEILKRRRPPRHEDHETPPPGPGDPLGNPPPHEPGSPEE
jgi:Spy/CpxP family protein refolding chaperone